MTDHTRGRRSPHLPVVAVSAAAALLIAALAAASMAGSQRQLELVIGTVVTTVPSLAALWYAERASRDIRNGTVTEKAREGAQAALDETGVTEVVEVTRRGESSVLAMEALSALLRTANADANETRHRRDTGEGTAT